MAEISSYAPGTPSWIDVMSPDLAATEEFYAALFGWTAVDGGPVEETGGYRMFTLNGKFVAGAMRQMEGQGHPSWSTYICVEDADATAEMVRANGGQVLAEPIDVMTAGRMAVLMDSTGAAFSIWQPKDHIGAQLANEPGTFCWNELNSRNPEMSKEFYGAVFGWRGVAQDNPGGMDYTEWHQNNGMIAGMLTMGDMFPPEVPSNWMVYFAVEDADATAAQTEALGGKIIVPPTDIPVGRFTVLSDPQGIAFSVIQLTPQ